MLRLLTAPYCEYQFRWVRSHYILGNSNPHLPHHYYIHYHNSYSNNGINGIKAPLTWFLLATFMMLSIIPLHQILFGPKLCLFIKFINDDISYSYKCSCKSLKVTWLISHKELINLNSLSLLLLSPSPKLLVIATQIVFFYQIH